MQDYAFNTPIEELTSESIWKHARSCRRRPNDQSIREDLKNIALTLSQKGEKERENIYWRTLGKPRDEE